MITAILAAIHARKWLVELIVLALVGGLIWAGCARLIEHGVQLERAVWMGKVEQANLEAARQKGLAEAAEANGKREHNELTTYVADHPLHGSLGSLCHATTGMPAATRAKPGDAAAPASAADVLSLPERSVGGDAGEPDQLGMLSVLAERADLLSAQVREWQAR